MTALALSRPSFLFELPENPAQLDTIGTEIFGVAGLGFQCSQQVAQHPPGKLVFDTILLTSGGIACSTQTPTSDETLEANLKALRSRTLIQNWVLHAICKARAASAYGEPSQGLRLSLNMPKEDLTCGGWTSWFDTIVQRVIANKKWELELSKLKELQTGWNGYRAAAPTRTAIEISRRYLHTAEQQDFEPKRVEASVMGGVGVTHRQGNRKVYVEFYNNGTAHGLFSDRTGRMHTMSVAAGEDELRRFIAKAKDYLNGRDPT